MLVGEFRLFVYPWVMVHRFATDWAVAGAAGFPARYYLSVVNMPQWGGGGGIECAGVATAALNA